MRPKAKNNILSTNRGQGRRKGHSRHRNRERVNHMGAHGKKVTSPSEYVEPETDFFDEVGQFRVAVKLPGVSEEKIRIELEGINLTVFASGLETIYRKELLIPGKTRFGGKKFQDGKLEIILDKVF